MIKDVFIAMPFGEQRVVKGDKIEPISKAHFDDLYEVIQKAVHTFRESCSVKRMEQKHGDLPHAIIERLDQADLVIAVLTGRNANVFYELGIRHSLHRRTIMLLNDRADSPFDLSGYFSQIYGVSTGEEREKLTDFLVERLAAYDDEDLNDSPVLNVLERGEHEQWRILNTLETRRAAVVLYRMLIDVSMVALWNREWVRGLDEVIESGLPEVGKFASPPLGVNIHSIDGFVANGLVTGLTDVAYIDAANLISQLGNAVAAARSATIHLQARVGDSTEIARGLLEQVNDVRPSWIQFGECVHDALAYVLESGRSYGIPWLNVNDLEGSSVDWGSRSSELHNNVFALKNRYQDYERTFAEEGPT